MVQFIKYDSVGDEVLVSASSIELRKLGWSGSTSNLPAAYLTGLLAGKRATQKKIKNAVFDIGLHSPTKDARVFASLRGILDAGVSVPHGNEILPDNDRISGKHISESYQKDFEEMKDKILKDVDSLKSKTSK